MKNILKALFDGYVGETIDTTALQFASLDVCMEQWGWYRLENNSYCHVSGRDFMSLEAAVLLHNTVPTTEYKLVHKVYLRRENRTVKASKWQIRLV